MPRRPRSVRTFVLYVVALLREFRITLLILLAALVLGSTLYGLNPAEFAAKGIPLNTFNALYASWMALLAQPINSPPTVWYLGILVGCYPILGFIVIGEGVVRLALLMVSRRHGRKEWMKVMASTYRDHVVLCGIGHLGIRVLEQLKNAAVPVVAIEKDEAGQFVAAARELNTPVIIGDMKEDRTLVDAGIPHASVVVIATNNDIANLEVALDSRRLNPSIRVVMRLFEQSIAQKIAGAFLVDVAFSASTLAAPIVAAMSLGTRVLSSTVIAKIPHVTAEVTLTAGGQFTGSTVAQAERAFCCRILARTPANAPLQLPPDGGAVLCEGDLIVVHTPSAQLATLAAAAQGEAMLAS